MNASISDILFGMSGFIAFVLLATIILYTYWSARKTDREGLTGGGVAFLVGLFYLWRVVIAYVTCLVIFALGMLVRIVGA